MLVMVTGVAGFIGSGTALRLLRDGHQVVGVDNLTPYYDVSLKRARLARLAPYRDFVLETLDLTERTNIVRIFQNRHVDAVLHFAAQPGVRHAVEHPEAYIDSNLVAFGNVIEQCRRAQVSHFVYASSSSVYGANQRLPFSERDAVDHPVSLYAATKRCNELIAHSYAHLYGLPCTGLRFFTVYGPWMRPDMAIYRFADRIMHGRTIEVHNRGEMLRDFTFIDDVVEGVMRLLGAPPRLNPSCDTDRCGPSRSRAPFQIFNIGGAQPVHLMSLIGMLEQALGRKAVLELVPMQAGEMRVTAADNSDINAAVGFVPSTPIDSGIRRFAQWYLEYTGMERTLTASNAAPENMGAQRV